MSEMTSVICRHCDMTSLVPVLPKGYVAKCSRCRSVIYQKSPYSFNGILALCITSLIIIYPAFTYPLFSMYMLGITENTSLISGMLMLLNSDPIVAFVVLFCGVVAPLFLLLTITFSTGCLVYNYHPNYLPKIFKITRQLTHWSMLDVYLLSLLVSIAKLMHYADLRLDLGFYFFVSLLLINVATLSAYSNRAYWEKFLQAENCEDAISGRGDAR
jgi:paraquat-inducible protein A